ncbi:phage repressor protein CI [Pantoea agglomerans]|uniref:Phage repressor protein CI n=1 Tax=Enterobacter agglomerans TaxID=549 RepID=A0ACC5RK28_ENTAG|nr:phage repressor protein CI [Pantoea agglomerans]MBK4725054.1 phage repressor protein CI [Pantoea agglomerans]
MAIQKRKSSLPTDSANVLDRVCEIYGFTTSLQLAEYLDMATSSMSARRKRGVFPADIVVQCCLETGANLEWIAKGIGSKFDKSEQNFLQVPTFKLVDGELFESTRIELDRQLFLPGFLQPADPICIQDYKNQYIVDKQFSEIYDGKWLVKIEGNACIRTIVRIPVNRVRISGGGAPLDCALEDIQVIGRVDMIITN